VSRVATYFFLTFAISWSCFIGAALVAPAGTAPTTGLPGIIYIVGVFGPALAAVAMTMWAEGRDGVVALLRRMLQAPSEVRWYLFALAYLPAVKLSAAALHRLALGAWPAFCYTPWYLMLLAIPFSTPVQSGEEVGWRGYALPRLADRIGLGPASVVLGVIWGVWHLPFFFMADVDKSGQSIPLYVVGTTALSVAMAWLYARTNGSLLITMLMHAAINNTTDIVPTAAAGAANPYSLHATPIAWITAALLWTVALWCLVRMPGGEAPRPRQLLASAAVSAR